MKTRLLLVPEKGQHRSFLFFMFEEEKTTRMTHILFPCCLWSHAIQTTVEIRSIGTDTFSLSPEGPLTNHPFSQKRGVILRYRTFPPAIPLPQMKFTIQAMPIRFPQLDVPSPASTVTPPPPPATPLRHSEGISSPSPTSLSTANILTNAPSCTPHVSPISTLGS